MIEEEISKLKEKIQELKTNYENARQNRIQVVNDIYDLDNQITNIDNIQQEMIQEHTNYIVNKEYIKKAIKMTLITTGIGAIIHGIISLILKDFSMYLYQVLFILTLSATGNFLPPILTMINDKKIKKVNVQNALQIEEKYKELINKRISKGQEYKKAREEEVIAENLYKNLEKILTVKITNMKIFGENFSEKNTDFKDIYYKIKLDSSFNLETIEEQKTILDDELRKYLSLKLSEIYYNVITPQDLEILTTEELMTIIINEIPTNMHNETLNHIIHAIINFSGSLQGYCIIWYEEENDTLIQNPELIFDEEGKWIEFKTNKNTPYQIIFNSAYDTFLSKVMVKNDPKIKTRI